MRMELETNFVVLAADESRRKRVSSSSEINIKIHINILLLSKFAGQTFFKNSISRLQRRIRSFM